MTTERNSAYSALPGIYNVDYFSGAQCAVYIGDIWVDEITSINYSTRQTRNPLYGYNDQLFRQLSKGQVIVMGQFTINFKEAGYLWLVLNEYKNKIKNENSPLENKLRNVEARRTSSPFIKAPNKAGGGEALSRANVEQIVNNRDSNGQPLSAFERIRILEDIAAADAAARGFSSTQRSTGGIGKAENIFEDFEDVVWKGGTGNPALDYDRRADDPDLNPFDIYVTYGDYTGNNSLNHTVHKIEDVSITTSERFIMNEGEPIQERYSFIARNLI